MDTFMKQEQKFEKVNNNKMKKAEIEKKAAKQLNKTILKN